MNDTVPLPARFIHQATRYCLGRATYAASEHCEWLCANWNQLPQEEKNIIQKDVEQAFAQDDRAREQSSHTKFPGLLPLGMDMDRYYWEKVRALWDGGYWKKRDV